MGPRQLAVSIIVACAIALVPSKALAGHGEPRRIDVPAGNVISAINSLARQTGVTIGGTQSDMRNIRTRRVQGRMTAQAALRRLLDGTPYTYRRISGHAFRIVRKPRPEASSPTARQRASRAQSRARPVQQQVVGEPILVVASKNDAELKTYPGSATVLNIGNISPARLSGGIEDTAASLPFFTTTHLGPGRNKIFIRGFADSSFNGPSQSTTATYLDEYRLVYSAPNPDLRSVDLQSIELLEGPQGTMYGAGSLGGTLRIAQSAPDPDSLSAYVRADFTAVEGGGSSGSIAGSINLPVSDSSAFRLVGYRQDLPGYIDDFGRDLQNVNRSTISGWRASFGASVLSDWDVRIDALQQDIDTDDGQYTEPDIGVYARSTAVAQPFSSDVALAGLTISRSWETVDLVSATNWTKSDLESRFDLGSIAADGNPQFFEEERIVELFNHETRLNGGTDRLKWVAGLSAIRNDDRRTQLIGTKAQMDELEQLDTETTEIAVFSEINRELVDRLDLTLGLRLVHSRIVTELDLGSDGDIEPVRQQLRALPTLALGYRLSEDWYGYVRYQEGFRSGGTTIVAGDNDDPDIENFDADKVSYFESGLRGAIPSLSISELSMSFSYAEWEDIQTDIIDEDGFPFTANLGTGEIYSANLALKAQPWRGFDLEARAFVSHSETFPAEEEMIGDEGEFPNIPELGVTLAASQSLFEREQSQLTIGADYTFVSESILALQPDLELGQGNLSVGNAWLAYRFGNNQVTFTVRNVLNASENRFSFGNPFTAFEKEQATPLQPRTFNITVSRDF